ncbi:MAG: hypothetical protein H6737_12465 [Alphaproteobacteria bacterium]|nr:hypothetical protein [Alphaproteobacteria bacterium]
MSPIVAGIGGLLIGLAFGWFVGHGTRSNGASSPELAARQKALEDEHRRLAHELSERDRDRDRSLADLDDAQGTARAAADENRKLIRRVRDLEAALKSATRRDATPLPEIELQLAMALRERDAAQRALMEMEARNAIEKSRPTPGGADADSFDALPDLGDDDEDEDLGFGRDEHDTLDDPVPHSLPPAERSDAPPSVPPASDDLTRLAGVGPATRDKLVELGFSTLAQLASLSDEGIADLERQLGSRRPSRDDWRGQAEALLSSTQED